MNKVRILKTVNVKEGVIKHSVKKLNVALW
jgi:hypothetical protein